MKLYAIRHKKFKCMLGLKISAEIQRDVGGIMIDHNLVKCEDDNVWYTHSAYDAGRVIEYSSLFDNSLTFPYHFYDKKHLVVVEYDLTEIPQKI